MCNHYDDPLEQMLAREAGEAVHSCPSMREYAEDVQDSGAHRTPIRDSRSNENSTYFFEVIASSDRSDDIDE